MPEFRRDLEIPFALKINKAGLATVKVEKLENLEAHVELFIKDNLDGETYKINQKPFEINLEPGEYTDRFSLVFQPRLQTIDEVNLNSGMLIFADNVASQVRVEKILDTQISRISVYNMSGELVKNWQDSLDSRSLFLPIHINAGMYIIQVQTAHGTLNKKVIFN